MYYFLNLFVPLVHKNYKIYYYTFLLQFFHEIKMQIEVFIANTFTAAKKIDVRSQIQRLLKSNT